MSNTINKLVLSSESRGIRGRIIGSRNVTMKVAFGPARIEILEPTDPASSAWVTVIRISGRGELAYSAKTHHQFTPGMGWNRKD